LEAGYDFQHDIRRDDAIAAAEADDLPLAKTNDRHSVRAFVGYTAELDDSVGVASGLEYLQGLDPATNYRLNRDGRSTLPSAGAFQSRLQSACATITTQSLASKIRTSLPRSASFITSCSAQR
jgi:hypothetical protein